MSDISELAGKTLLKIDKSCDELVFYCVDGDKFRMFHDQDCCESVFVEDIAGNLADLIGSPILKAEEADSSEEPAPENSESYTWTFYLLATVNGYVTIRWLGESNGCYSESVDFEKMN